VFADKLNIVLILLAALVACIFPIETFLFSYAVLGPLHYITELNWLDEKKYFTNNKKSIWFFISIAAFLTSITLLVEYSSEYWLFIRTDFLFPIFIFGALLFSIISGTKSSSKRVNIFLIAALLFAIAHHFNWSYILLAVLLPTIIHVYFFTGNFLLLGAIKSRDIWNAISFSTFLIVSITVLLVPINFSFSQNGSEQLLSSIHFKYLIEWLSGESFQGDVSQHQQTIQVLRFLAFAYSYHYLNWFSKTKVIGWLKVSKPKLALAFSVWALSVSCYYYDYKTGFFLLFFLSILHVLAEFPLNYITLKNTIVALRNFKVQNDDTEQTR
jgi:branched-subunit amino acid transport protein AzlD